MIRNATVGDAKRLLEIYDYYVRETAVSFEYETPALSEFENRIAKTLEKYPYLVAEDEGKIVGYAYAGAFHPRDAYRFCSEVTIYLDHDARGRGYGRLLYEALEERLKTMGIKNLYSCIGDPDAEDEYLTKDSEEFHRHMGYKKIGTFTKCGYKFGRWYNMIWMEKFIGEHEE